MRFNGTTNINILQSAAKHKVSRVVLVNATMPTWSLIAPYREGKLAAEREALRYPEQCGTDCEVLVIKPGAITGTREEGNLQIPLWIVLEPMRMVMSLLSKFPADTQWRKGLVKSWRVACQISSEVSFALPCGWRR